MNVSLTPELEQLVNRKVASGLYSSASEVIREGLRLLEERDGLRELRRERLRELVDRGIADLDAGDYETFDSAVSEDVKRAGRRRLNSSGQP